MFNGCVTASGRGSGLFCSTALLALLLRTSATLTLEVTVINTISANDALQIDAWWGLYGTGNFSDIDSTAAGDAYDPSVSDISTDDLGDGIPDDDEVSFSVSPQAPDLEITKTVSKSNPDVGEEVTFTITLTNNGQGNATGVSLTDYLPANLVYTASSASNSGVFNDA